MAFEWNDIKVFLAVAISGCLSGAAHQLNKSQSTIGRRIEKLEAELEKCEVDIAICSRRPTSHNLITRSLGQCRYAVYASAGYVLKNPTAKTEKRVQACRWISFCEGRQVVATESVVVTACAH